MLLQRVLVPMHEFFYAVFLVPTPCKVLQMIGIEGTPSAPARVARANVSRGMCSSVFYFR